MSAYIIVDIEVTDPAGYEEYKSLTPGSIAAYGGTYLARGGRTEVLEGEWTPQRLVILQFPTFDRAKAWLHSQEYAPARALRHRHARTNMVLVDGVPANPPDATP